MAQKKDLRVPLCAVIDRYVDESVLKSWGQFGVRKREGRREEGGGGRTWSKTSCVRIVCSGSVSCLSLVHRTSYIHGCQYDFTKRDRGRTGSENPSSKINSGKAFCTTLLGLLSSHVCNPIVSLSQPHQHFTHYHQKQHEPQPLQNHRSETHPLDHNLSNRQSKSLCHPRERTGIKSLRERYPSFDLSFPCRFQRSSLIDSYRR